MTRKTFSEIFETTLNVVVALILILILAVVGGIVVAGCLISAAL